MHGVFHLRDSPIDHEDGIRHARHASMFRLTRCCNVQKKLFFPQKWYKNQQLFSYLAVTAEPGEGHSHGESDDEKGREELHYAALIKAALLTKLAA